MKVIALALIGIGSFAIAAILAISIKEPSAAKTGVIALWLFNSGLYIGHADQKLITERKENNTRVKP
jgi:hypothetical protein